jgi:hypothetical protein
MVLVALFQTMCRVLFYVPGNQPPELQTTPQYFPLAPFELPVARVRPPSQTTSLLGLSSFEA